MTTPSTPSPAARFRFRKRYVALTLMAVLVGGYIAWRISITSRIEAELERIRAEGYPASLEELNAWEPPGLAEGNAAEVYLRAFEAMVRHDTELEADVPGLGADYPEPGEALPENQRAASEAYLAASNRAIEYLKQAAEIEACKFPQKVSTEFDQELLDVYTNLRRAARLLHVHARMLADRGDGDEAARSLVAILRLGRSLRPQSVLITRIVSISINLLAVDAVEQVTSRSLLSTETAAMLQREFERAMDRQDVAWAVAGERCYYLDVQSNYAAALIEHSPESNGWGVKLKARLWPMLGLHHLDLLHALRWFEINIDAARSGDDWPDASEFLKTVPNYALTTRMLLTGLGRPGRSEHLHLMRLRTAAAALAAYRYKLDHARWPDTLDALVGQYLTELPLDVFNHNQPLQMKRDGEGLVIYSFGQNQTDDGGEGTELADIVFRLTR